MSLGLFQEGVPVPRMQHSTLEAFFLPLPNPFDLLAEPIGQSIEVITVSFDGSPVGEMEPGPGALPKPLDGVQPDRQVELRWRGRDGDEVGRGEQHRGGIACEADRFMSEVEFEDVVVPGVSRGLHGPQVQLAEDELLAVDDRVDQIGRSRDCFSPEGIHRGAVDSGGTGEQFRGIDQVTGSELMDMNRYATPRQVPSGSRVIEVDVGYQACIEILDGQAVGGESGFENVERTTWPGLDEHGVLPIATQPGPDGPGQPEVHEVDWVDGDGQGLRPFVRLKPARVHPSIPPLSVRTSDRPYSIRLLLMASASGSL